jgi:hypothetical protein
MDAERTRKQLAKLTKKQTNNNLKELRAQQQEDIRIFFSMVAQHQENFDDMWKDKSADHKTRADELIEALKFKHENEQHELYEQLKKRRMPKFSVELLNLRKRQVTLARAKHYVDAEKLKRKADMLEAIELDRIRKQAKHENQTKFKALLKKQAWDRSALANKLRLEKKVLLEAKGQDLNRLKKRLRNAESELRKTHLRQTLVAEKKISHKYAKLAPKAAAGSSSKRKGGSTRRKGGKQRPSARQLVGGKSNTKRLYSSR